MWQCPHDGVHVAIIIVAQRRAIDIVHVPTITFHYIIAMAYKLIINQCSANYFLDNY